MCGSGVPKLARGLLGVSAILTAAFVALIPATAHAGCGTAGEGCWALDPCCSGYSCHPFLQKCFHDPRRQGEPCLAGYPCGPGLTCEAGSQVCRAPGGAGDPCHLTRPCGPGLSCQPGVHKCYHSPRRPGEPCVAGHECQPGFHCLAGMHKCVAGEIDYSAGGLCNRLKIDDLSQAARNAGTTMTYSYGSSGGAGAFISIENGTAYGQHGEFGCFVTACAGVITDVAIADFANFGFYEGYDKVPGLSVVTQGGASFPGIELGGSGGQIWAAEQPGSAGDILKKNLVGSLASVSFGIGLAPAQLTTAACWTELIGGDQPIAGLRGAEANVERAARRNAAAGGSGGTISAGGTPGSGEGVAGSSCQSAVQGRIAWDYAGNTSWNHGNVERLCRGVRDDQPARCFERVMHGGVSWGGGTRWEWANALDLCEGSPDAEATIACFRTQIMVVGLSWSSAIQVCGR